MQTKTEKLVIKVLPDDKRELERMAQAEGESMAVIVRRLIRAAAKTRQAGQAEPKGALCNQS